MKSFLIRNIKLYFRDKGAVFFSILSVLIIILLYALFLGDIWLREMNGIANAEQLMNSWVTAGIIAVTSITATTGGFGTLVLDRVQKKARDFYTSPLTRRAITGGYLIANYIIGCIMTVLALMVSELYIVCAGGEWLPFLLLCKALGLILLTTLSNTAMLCFLVSFFKSNNAFTGASIILGTLVGFLTGVYLPIGQLGEGVQWIIKLFPASHGAVLFRQIMMEQVLASAFADAPVQVLELYQEAMGITFTYQGYLMKQWVHILVIIATGILFYMLALWNMRQKAKIA